MATTYPENIDVRLDAAPLVKENGSGWICVIVEGSGELFGTRKPVKVAGTVDGHPIDATMLPMGDGSHMFPLRAAVRKALGKGVGDHVSIHLDTRKS